MKNPNTTLRELLQKNSSQIVDFKFADNEQAHTIINEIIKKLIDRISAIEKIVGENLAPRLENLEQFATTQLLGPSSLQYKPPGQDEYVGLGGNLDILYDRLNKLEDVIYGDGK